MEGLRLKICTKINVCLAAKLSGEKILNLAYNSSPKNDTADRHLQRVTDWLCISTSYKPTSQTLDYPFNVSSFPLMIRFLWTGAPLCDVTCTTEHVSCSHTVGTWCTPTRCSSVTTRWSGSRVWTGLKKLWVNVLFFFKTLRLNSYLALFLCTCFPPSHFTFQAGLISHNAAGIWGKPGLRDARPCSFQHLHSGPLHPDQPTDLVPERDTGGHLPQGRSAGLHTPRYRKPTAGNIQRVNFVVFALCLVTVAQIFHSTDPNNIYAWQTEPTESKDKLDFRHHNYKEMRKVTVSDGYVLIFNDHVCHNHSFGLIATTALTAEI